MARVCTANPSGTPQMYPTAPQKGEYGSSTVAEREKVAQYASTPARPAEANHVCPTSNIVPTYLPATSASTNAAAQPTPTPSARALTCITHSQIGRPRGHGETQPPFYTHCD
eukprot:1300152-Rhodomonas_salina.2